MHWATAAMSQGSISLTANEALSGVFGSISLASWIFLLVSEESAAMIVNRAYIQGRGYSALPIIPLFPYQSHTSPGARDLTSTPANPPQVPQLIENYKQGSAEGISLAFLTVWFVGDVTNLIGALWAGLVPTVIALAIYFCFADLILISQCVYYNLRNSRRSRKTSTRSTDSVEAPLLGRRDSSNIGLPGSHRRDSQASRRRRASSLPTVADVEAGGSEWIKNALSIIGVCVVGAAGWAIAWKTGVWEPQPTNDDAGKEIALGAQIFGYASAVCYLGARIPQIIKNQREKSCEGLSLLFFMLSLLGNATYGAGVSLLYPFCYELSTDLNRFCSTRKRRSTSSPTCPG